MFPIISVEIKIVSPFNSSKFQKDACVDGTYNDVSLNAYQTNNLHANKNSKNKSLGEINTNRFNDDK